MICFKNLIHKAHSFSTLTSTAEVLDYLPSRDQEKVSRIAVEHLTSLTSLRDENQDGLVQSAIMPAFKSDFFYKKVIRIDNDTAGFIVYCKYENYFVKKSNIEFLAIDSQHQKKGYGSVLLEEALKHLENEKVGLVELKITSDNPIPFYTKHRFAVIHYPTAVPPKGGVMSLSLNDASLPLSGRILKKAYTHRPGRLVKILCAGMLFSIAYDNIRTPKKT